MPSDVMDTLTSDKVGPLKKIPLVEMFGPTIQGEGAVIGVQTYFLRFGLCDYKCTMCDSMHAVDPMQVKKNAKMMTQHEILEAFGEFYKPGSTKWITFSGGNPCIHDLTYLVDMLKEAGFMIAVETQGTKHPYWLQAVDLVTVSPKGPGMGEELEIDVLDEFMQALSYDEGPYVNMKVVIFDQRDLEVAKQLIERYEDQLQPETRFFLSLGNTVPPSVDGSSDIDPHLHREMMVTNYQNLWNDIQNDPWLSRVRFLPQWHVFVWGNAKGV